MSDVITPQIECSELSDKYGRFVIDPLAHGFGITIGNALRRVLLSSLPGAAITWIRINGIQHEFSSVPHMKEDTIDLILNVKSIRIRSNSSCGGILMLDIKGEKEVTAGDIEQTAELEVVNPELHLATLDSPDANLSIEFNVEQSTGFRPATHSAKPSDFGEGLPIGVIPVDAIFTPVRKVNYNVETFNIGQQSYERLILDVWTDGTISPVEAVSRSGHVLIEQFQLFYELARVPLKVGEKQPRLPIPLEQYNKPIEELGLSVRTFNCLKRVGIIKVGELLEKNNEELLSIKNFGQKALEEVRDKLLDLGFVNANESADAEEGSN